MFDWSAGDDIIKNCESGNAQLYANLTDLEKVFVTCEYCPLNESELNELFNSGKCLPSDYSHYFPIVYIMYGAILLVSLPGNFLVILTVLSFKKLHSVTHFFIANMAVGDLLVTIFCIPFSVASVIVLQYWPFGTTFCIIVNYLQAISVFASAYTLVAISIDRYLAIIYPLRLRLSQCQAKVIMACVWALAFFTTAPVAVFSSLTTPDERLYLHMNLQICKEEWPSESMVRGYTLALMLLQYFFPVIVLLVTYGRIATYVWGTSRSKSEASFSSSIYRNPQPRSRSIIRKCASDYSPAKMIRMTLTVVLVYTLCWLPFNILQVVRDFWPSIHDWDYMHITWFICHWLAVSHSCYNPLILCWMNVKFRKCLVNILITRFLGCFCPRRRNALKRMLNIYQPSSWRTRTRNASGTISMAGDTTSFISRNSRINGSGSIKPYHSDHGANCEPLLDNSANQVLNNSANQEASEHTNRDVLRGRSVTSEIIPLRQLLERPALEPEHF